jgi:hypothetical protein
MSSPEPEDRRADDAAVYAQTAHATATVRSPTIVTTSSG